MSTTLPVVKREYLDNSILESMGRCPRLAYHNYHLCRSARTINYPINFGVAFHVFCEQIEALYTQWVVVEEKTLESCSALIYEVALALAMKDWEDPPLEHKKSYLDRGRLEKNLKEQFANWLNEKTLGYYKIIGTETSFCLPLPRRLCLSCFTWSEDVACSKGCFEPTVIQYFAGRLDQIIEWNRRLWVRDWKTVGRKEDFDKKFNPAHQFSGYCWAAKQLSGRSVDGVIVHVAHNIKSSGPNFHPVLCNRSNADIEQWLEWVEFETANYRRAEAEDIWPMRTSACGDYGGCFFRDCCREATWHSIEAWLKERTIYSVWDPLNPQIEEAEALPE